MAVNTKRFAETALAAFVKRSFIENRRQFKQLPVTNPKTFQTPILQKKKGEEKGKEKQQNPSNALLKVFVFIVACLVPPPAGVYESRLIT